MGGESIYHSLAKLEAAAQIANRVRDSIAAARAELGDKDDGREDTEGTKLVQQVRKRSSDDGSKRSGYCREGLPTYMYN